MAKNKKLPLFATAGAAVYGMNAYHAYTVGNNAGKGMAGLRWATLGIANDGKFYWSQFVMNSLPLIVGVGGSMVAAKTGMNRYVQSIPFVKM